MKPNKISQALGLVTLTWLLSACGSDNDSIAIEAVSAQLDEDSTWQQNFAFSDTPFVVTNAANGQVSVTQTGISYTPNLDYNGSDAMVVESGNTRYNITFDISAVNDLPTLATTNLTVSAADSISGELSASDVDGDTVTFALVTAPENGSIDVKADGNFVYTPSDFTLPIDNFTVVLNDGTASVNAQVELIPSYATNSDKSAYYFRSAQSHLKRADDVLNAINDDIASEDAYVALAMGYATAGFDSQVERLLANNLNTQQAKAQAFRRLGVLSEEFDQDVAALDYFEQALQTYAQFLADNGIENLSSGNAGFLQGLFSNARELNNSALSAKILDQLNIYAATLGGADKPYSSAFGRLITAYRDEVENAINNYRQDRSDDNKVIALDAAERFAVLVKQTGTATVRRGDNAGKTLHRLGPLYSSQAIGYFYDLNELEKAKAQLAFTFSYYKAADFDDNHLVAANIHSEITLAEYNFPLALVAYYHALLYPSQTNITDGLYAATDRNFDGIQNAIRDAQVINTFTENGDIDAAIAAVETLYADSARDVQERLTSRGIFLTPYLGEALLNLGNKDAAIAAFDRALEIITSAEYLDQNTNITLYATGTRGCLKIVEFFERIDEDSKALAASNQCNTIRMDYFGDDNPDDRDVVKAHIEVIDALEVADNDTPIAEVITSVAARLENYSRNDWFFRLTQLAAISADKGDLDLAIVSAQRVVDILLSQTFETLEDKVDAHIDALDVLVALDFEDESFRERPAVLIGFRNNFTQADYKTKLAAINAIVKSVSDSLITVTKELSVAELSDKYEDIFEKLGDARQYHSATALITELGLSGEEKIFANVLIAQALALQDDFPSTNIATVDTDGDGLANFVLTSASDEDIDDADIVLDDDADDDGIADADDLTPLGNGV